jgi:2-succinyl-5-enolpyruvyl-6-hydroxy-3-cyclohexene-1-carboxylate synthase
LNKKSINTGTLNFQWAFSLIHNFSLHGADQAVISPGSRSTPLALACEKHTQIKTWVQIDERSAAFFALGLAQSSAKPVILVCTSGTAVANWFPAVIEANYSSIPLLLLSADRPEELQHCGANQTIDQTYLFGTHVRKYIALEHAEELLLHSNYLKKIATLAISSSLQEKPGPVHINIPFREPLLPKRFTSDELNSFIQLLATNVIKSSTPVIKIDQKSTHLTTQQLRTLYRQIDGKNGMLICGRGHYSGQFPRLITRLAEKLNCPILVDPLSNLRFGQHSKINLVYNYDTFLNYWKKDIKPDWVIGIGQFPVSKSLLKFMQAIKTIFLLIDPMDEWLDPSQTATDNLRASPESVCSQLLQLEFKPAPNEWLKSFLQADKQIEQQLEQVITQKSPFFEADVIISLFNELPDQSMVFSGNSMAIRDLDSFITKQMPTDKNISLFCNRGSSGIDGNLSTYFGLLINNNYKYSVALVGDLSFYHDMNGLLICRTLAEQGYQGTIILLNNHGGGIFNYLPQNQLHDFEKLWNTDTRLDFQHSARLYGLNYQRIEDKEHLSRKFSKTFKQPGFNLIEIMINQQTSVTSHKLCNSIVDKI